MVRKPVLSEHCLHRFSQSEGGGPAQLVRALAGRPLATGALDSGLLRGGEGQRQVRDWPWFSAARSLTWHLSPHNNQARQSKGEKGSRCPPAQPVR